MVEIVRGYVAAELEPMRASNEALAAENKALAERLAVLEARELVLPMPGERGNDGADCDMEAVALMLDQKFAAAMEAIPPAEPGPPGKDGADVDMSAVEAMIERAVKSATESLPVPKDGHDGKDGLGLANALIDREGELIVTFTDGSSKNLGIVVGKNGADGKDGHTFTLDDFDIEPIDERTIKMGFTYGEVKHTFELAIPAVIYRNVWKEGETYQRGDMVTWAGSIWHCDADACTTKPDAGGYTLAVKRGRDGRDAK